MEGCWWGEGAGAFSCKMHWLVQEFTLLSQVHVVDRRQTELLMLRVDAFDTTELDNFFVTLNALLQKTGR